MSKDRRDRPDGAADRPGPLANPVILGAQKNRLLDLLERRRDPRQPQDVKERLVSRWKQTLALNNARARRPVAAPAAEPAPASKPKPKPEPGPKPAPESEPAPKPASRREPPKPPNPLRSPGRIAVNRIRRDNDARVDSVDDTMEATPAPVLATPEIVPEPEAALELDAELEPEVAAAPEPAIIAHPVVVAEPVVLTEPEPEPAPVHSPAISVRVRPQRAAAQSRWVPVTPSLTRTLTDVAVQAAGTVLAAAALKVGQTLLLFG